MGDDCFQLAEAEIRAKYVEERRGDTPDGLNSPDPQTASGNTYRIVPSAFGEGAGSGHVRSCSKMCSLDWLDMSNFTLAIDLTTLAEMCRS
jgi:hypothetical protein